MRRALAQINDSAFSRELISESIDHRFARTIAQLPRLPAPEVQAPISIDTRLRRTSLAMSQMVRAPALIDFTIPGDHLLVHPGAEAALRTIAEGEEFAVSDLGKDLSPEVRVALAAKFVAAGFLEPAREGCPPS